MNTGVGEREAEQAFSVAGIPAGATRAEVPCPAANRGDRSHVRPGKPGLQTTLEWTLGVPQFRSVHELGWRLGRSNNFLFLHLSHNSIGNCIRNKGKGLS